MPDNPDEWFDVVDAHDRVTGRARRADVHANGWRHRAVHILVERADGAVFLQRRSLGKDSHPGRWDSSASGHLDSGEAYADAAVRELREELGIEPQGPLEEIAALPATPATGQEFVRIYRTRHPGPFRLNAAEIMDGRWVAPAALEAWLAARPDDFAPCFHEVWRAAATRKFG